MRALPEIVAFYVVTHLLFFSPKPPHKVGSSSTDTKTEVREAEQPTGGQNDVLAELDLSPALLDYGFDAYFNPLSRLSTKQLLETQVKQKRSHTL